MAKQALSELADEVYELLVSKISPNSILPNYSKSILKTAIAISCKETYKLLTRGEIVESKESIISALFASTKMQLKYYKNVHYHPCIVTNIIDFTLNQNKEEILIGLTMPSTPTLDQFEKVETEIGFLNIIKADCINDCIINYRTILSRFEEEEVNIICFPELCGIDNDDFKDYLITYSSTNEIVLISGTYHNLEKKENICRIYLPDRRYFEQKKIFPSEKYDEGIYSEKLFDKIYLFKTQKITFVILICIDSERKAILNVIHELVDSGLGVDLIFNPSFTSAVRRVDADSVKHSLEYFFIPIFCNKIIESAIYCPLYDLKEDDFKMFVMKDKLYDVFALPMNIIKQMRDMRDREHPRMISEYK